MYKNHADEKTMQPLESLFETQCGIFRDIMKETVQHNPEGITILVEHFNNWLEIVLGRDQYTDEEMINSVSAVFLYLLGKQLQWVIFAVISGAYFQVLQTLRFVFESIINAHFIDEWFDREIVLRESDKLGASIDLKLEILQLIDEKRDTSRKKDFSKEDTQKAFAVIEKFFESVPKTDRNRYLKNLYEEVIQEYYQKLKNIGGRKGLIAQLPDHTFSRSNKEALIDLYGHLSKYSHLTSHVLKFIIDDPSQIFTPSFNDGLFNECIQLLTSVMDVFIAMAYLHFERLEVTDWLYRSVHDLQMPLSQKVLERRLTNSLKQKTRKYGQ